jgi:hypothetical protein
MKLKLGINVDGSHCKLCKKKGELCHIHLKKNPKKASVCWKGYEPVPGKAAYSKGSCRKISKV